MIKSKLALILLEPKVISLCHQYRTRLACTSMQESMEKRVFLWEKVEEKEEFFVGKEVNEFL